MRLIRQTLVTQVFNTAATEIAKSQDGVEGEALITDAEQLSSPFTTTVSGDGDVIDALIDGDASTYCTLFL